MYHDEGTDLFRFIVENESRIFFMRLYNFVAFFSSRDGVAVRQARLCLYLFQLWSTSSSTWYTHVGCLGTWVGRVCLQPHLRHHVMRRKMRADGIDKTKSYLTCLSLNTYTIATCSFALLDSCFAACIMEAASWMKLLPYSTSLADKLCSAGRLQLKLGYCLPLGA